MDEVKHDLHNTRTYLWIVVGLLLGIAFVMAAIRFLPNNFKSSNNAVQNQNQPSNISAESTATPEYQKALENPTEPYKDANGVTHPPIGVAPAPIDTSKPVQHPPTGGSAPVVPKAPVVPTAAPVTTSPKTPAVPAQ